MIADVDATIAAWLGEFLPGVPVSFEPPPERAEKPEGSGPAATELSVYLDDIREDLAAGTPGWTSLRDERGVVVGRMPPTRTYRLSYLLVAHGASTTDEHDLLGRVLAGSLMHEVVRGDLLAGQLKGAEGPVQLRCAPATQGIHPEHLWSAWGVAPRTWLELSVLAPMPSALVQQVAEPPSQIQLEATRRAADPQRNGSEHDGDVPRLTARIHED